MAYGDGGDSPSGSNPVANLRLSETRRPAGPRPLTWPAPRTLPPPSPRLRDRISTILPLPEAGRPTEYFLPNAATRRAGRKSARRGCAGLGYRRTGRQQHGEPEPEHDSRQLRGDPGAGRQPLLPPEGLLYGDPNDPFYTGNPSSSYRNFFIASSPPNATGGAGAASRLQITNSSAQATSMTFVVGDPTPRADFSASPTSGSVPLSVNFSAAPPAVRSQPAPGIWDGQTPPPPPPRTCNTPMSPPALTQPA